MSYLSVLEKGDADERKTSLADLKRELLTIEMQMDDLAARYRTVQRKYDSLLLGFAVGDTIEYRQKKWGGVGKPSQLVVTRGVVCKVAEHYPEMLLFKKNGDLGTKVMRIYDNEPGAITVIERAKR